MAHLRPPPHDAMDRASQLPFAKPESLPWWQDGRILAVIAAACFSLKAIWVKLAYAAHPVAPSTLLALRMALSLPAFLWLARQAGAEPLSRRDWAGLFVLGLVGYYLSSLFDFIGLQYISAGLERLILFTYPAIVWLVEAALRRQTVPGRVWLLQGVIYLGLLAAFWHDLTHLPSHEAVLIGGAWVFLSSLTFSCYYLGTGRLVGRIGSTRLAGASGAIASGLALGHFGLAGSMAELAVLPPAVWLWSLAMALVSTVFPIWLNARAVAKLGAGPTASISALGPALTIVFGGLLLGEAVSSWQMLGMALVIGGVWQLGKTGRH
ncbi:DMT family transporter [Chitinimonas lacunae]|uniref:DMT family transporter n=1 Tax=Chitinimonas lacunae TaxID=1963018 RepID=A0ABV8MXT0_9NEIS